MSYAVSLAYASRNAFPFSTYGENFFLTIQNVVITLLILYLSRSKPVYGQDGGNVTRVVLGGLVALVGGWVLWSPSLCPLSLCKSTMGAV